ncbi:MAG: HAD family hydrolase [Halioglobus sp.]|nr:HAD family hydrolase [Halioglobus sp.]
MTLAIFDLDNTLIGGDSDHLWAQFAAEQGLVDSANFRAQADRFYSDYERGELDIMAYLRFALSPLKGQRVEVAARWHRQFMREKIEPIFLPRAHALLQRHRDSGDELLIITATNRYITGPIASALGVDELIACDAEVAQGVYTGEPAGVPSYREGKVTRLHEWLQERQLSLHGAWFYSDSHNDLPLLELVDNPVAVDPDATLLARAREMGWQVISLRE